MLTALSELLYDAREHHYGIPALAVENELNLRCAIQASEESRSPLILLSGYSHTRDPEFFTATLNYYCDKAKTPVAVIMDHTATFEKAISGIRMGFGSIMVDRSKLPFEENASQVAELVRIAHACGVEVESELGHVGGLEYEFGTSSSGTLTVVEEAEAFVRQTKTDFLAVAIGTAHGLYQGTPELRFDLLNQLREAIQIPLVLHGASGTGDENIFRACQGGICKVNVGTELYMAVRDGIASRDLSQGHVYEIYQAMNEGYIATAKHWFQICGSKDRG